jgi:hypothetical protein
MHPYLRFELLLRRNGSAGEASAGCGVPAPVVRRILGKALIDRFCPFGQPLCESRPGGGERPAAPRELCHLADVCPYGVLFAASLTRRPPYAVYVPAGGGGEPGAAVDPGAGAAAADGRGGAGARLEITLYGPAWQLHAWVLASLQEALRRGVGKARQSWEVEEVTRRRPEGAPVRLAGGDLRALPAALRPDLLGLALEPYLAVREVAVELLSPARLLRDGRLVGGAERVPFDLLIARILDRFASLYGEGASEILRPEIRSVVEAEAASVPLLADDSSWVEVRDYSARSGAELLLGGKVGRLVYGSQAGRFLPILRAGEILHLGKNTASGCGRMRVTLVPEELGAAAEAPGREIRAAGRPRGG